MYSRQNLLMLEPFHVSSVKVKIDIKIMKKETNIEEKNN